MKKQADKMVAKVIIKLFLVAVMLWTFMIPAIMILK